MQPLLLFFVDGGSAIDADDTGWELLLALRPEGGHTVVARAPRLPAGPAPGRQACAREQSAVCKREATGEVLLHAVAHATCRGAPVSTCAAVYLPPASLAVYVLPACVAASRR
jgi:hypothetical protein